MKTTTMTCRVRPEISVEFGMVCDALGLTKNAFLTQLVESAIAQAREQK